MSTLSSIASAHSTDTSQRAILTRNFCGVSNNRSISAIDRERIDRHGSNAQEETAAATSAGGIHEETQNDTEESNAEEKNPAISNPRWENADNQTITKALVGDEVFLCADTENISDGTSAKIKIVEKDDDGNDDFVADLSTSVQEVSVIQLLSLMILETAGLSLSALKKSLMIKFMKKSLL